MKNTVNHLPPEIKGPLGAVSFTQRGATNSNPGLDAHAYCFLWYQDCYTTVGCCKTLSLSPFHTCHTDHLSHCLTFFNIYSSPAVSRELSQTILSWPPNDTACRWKRPTSRLMDNFVMYLSSWDTHVLPINDGFSGKWIPPRLLLYKLEWCSIGIMDYGSWVEQLEEFSGPTPQHTASGNFLQMLDPRHSSNCCKTRCAKLAKLLENKNSKPLRAKCCVTLRQYHSGYTFTSSVFNHVSC